MTQKFDDPTGGEREARRGRGDNVADPATGGSRSSRAAVGSGVCRGS